MRIAGTVAWLLLFLIWPNFYVLFYLWGFDEEQLKKSRINQAKIFFHSKVRKTLGIIVWCMSVAGAGVGMGAQDSHKGSISKWS